MDLNLLGLYHGKSLRLFLRFEEQSEAERREMERPKAQASKLKHSHNLAFDQLLWEADHERLPRELSKAMTRPAYKSTSLEQKTIYTRCDRC